MAIRNTTSTIPRPPPIYIRDIGNSIKLFNFKTRERKFISAFFRKEVTVSRNTIFDIYNECGKCTNQRFCYIKQKDESGFLFTYVWTKQYKYGRKEIFEKYLPLCPQYKLNFSNGRFFNVYVTLKSLFDKSILATKEEIRKFNDLNNEQLRKVKDLYVGICECEKYELPREIFSDCFMLCDKDILWFVKERESIERQISKGLVFDWMRYQANIYAYSKSEGMIISRSIYLTKKFLLEIFLKYSFFKEDMCEIGADETLVTISYVKAKVTEGNMLFLKSRLEMEEEEKIRINEKKEFCRIGDAKEINIDETIYDTYSDTDVC